MRESSPSGPQKTFIDFNKMDSSIAAIVSDVMRDGNLHRIEAVLEIVGDGSLAVDVNGRFDLETALEYGRAMEPYDPRWYEEPGDPLDFALRATAQPIEHISLTISAR